MIRPNEAAFLLGSIALVLLASAAGARAQSRILAWGDNSDGQCSPVPALPPGETPMQVDAGAGFSLARFSGGSMIAWGQNNYGQCNLPGPASFADVQGGGYHAVALLTNGTIQAWGRDDFQQCQVPPPPAGLVYTAVTAGAVHTVAALSDGSLVAWGNNAYGQCSPLPPIPAGRSVVRLAAGALHTLALLDDGTVIAWGSNSDGQCTVPVLPSNVTYVAIAGAEYHSAALRSNGTIVAWGSNASGELNVIPAPSGLVYTGVAAGGSAHLGFTAGLLSDGSVVAWGDDSFGQCDVPTLSDGDVYVEIESLGRHTVARYESTRFPGCFGDGTGPSHCPCGNDGSSGHGCANSAVTQGALLTSAGRTSLAGDTFVMTSSGERSTSLSIFLQGDRVTSPLPFGDGLRCVGGHLKRLYTKNASGGVVTAPGGADLPVSSRSAAAGDTIPAFGLRAYQVYYRDPNPAFCAAPTGNTFNISNSIGLTWYP